MRVLKNLLGDGSKIHAGEIQVSDLLNLMNSVIVEEGSNDDGQWIKLGNGAIIALGKTPEVHVNPTYEWFYPCIFSKKPYLFATTNQSTDSVSYTGVNYGVSHRTTGKSALLRKWGSDGMNYPFSLIAVMF